MSNNVSRRIKEHNKEKFGGGVYTGKKGPWEVLCHIHGFPDMRSAIQAERTLKLLTRHEYQFRRHEGKIKGLVHCLQTMEKWTGNYTGLIKEEKYCISIVPKYHHFLEQISEKKNITIIKLQDQTKLNNF